MDSAGGSDDAFLGGEASHPVPMPFNFCSEWWFPIDPRKVGHSYRGIGNRSGRGLWATGKVPYVTAAALQSQTRPLCFLETVFLAGFDLGESFFR